MGDRLAANVWKLTLTRALSTAYVHLPVVVLFWQENGLSLTQVMLLQSTFAVTTVLLELPSGMFADMHGRKPTLVIAALFNCIGIGIYCLSSGFYGFLLGEMALAVFVSLVSGADSALLFESLKALKRDGEFTRHYGTMVFVQTLVLGAANVAGGFIAAHSLRATIVAVLPFALLALVSAMTLTEPPRSRTVGPRRPGTQLREMRRVIGRDRVLFWLLIYAGIVLCFNQAGLWLYQPYFAVTGVDVVWFGAIFASFQLVSGLASKLGYRIGSRIGTLNGICLLIFVSGAASLLLGNLLFAFSFVLVYAHQIVRGLYKVLFTAAVNERVSTEVRASVLSVQNLTGRILTAVTGPFFGWYADVYTVQQTFSLIGVIALAAGLPVVLLLRSAAATSSGPQPDEPAAGGDLRGSVK